MGDFDYSVIPDIITGEPTLRDNYIIETGGKAGSDKNTFAKFTFRKENNGTGVDLLYPFPKELEAFINTGVFYLTEDDFPGFDYEKFLGSIPYAQIRAYEPHTVIQFGSDIMSTIFEGIEYANNNGIRAAGGAIIDGFVNTASNLAHFFTALCNEESFKAFRTTFSTTFNEKYATNATKIGENDVAILDIPYNLYYKILGSTTNAIYEIPCQFPDETLKSDGKFGWDSNEFNAFRQIGDFSTGSFKEALTFQFLLSFASKFNMTMMPVFSPNNSTSDPDGITITFNLMNDTVDHAKANFAFVQTITGNNKWIQNLIVTRPANLYDIRIPGCNRLMMCTGEFTIEFKGAVRTFKESALKDFTQPFGTDFRIPEAYSVSMKFDSLIPSNFNTYILGLIKSNEDLFEYNESERVENGVIGKFTDAVLKSAESAITVYDKRNDRISSIINGSTEDDYVSYKELSVSLINENPLQNESEKFDEIYKDELKKAISSSPTAEFEYPTPVPNKPSEEKPDKVSSDTNDTYKEKVEKWEKDKEEWDNYVSLSAEIYKNRKFVIEKAKENTIDRINEEREEAAKIAKKAAIEKEATENKNDNSSKPLNETNK